MGLAAEALGLHDARVVVGRRRRRRGRSGARSVPRPFAVAAAPPRVRAADALVLDPRHLVADLVDGEIERGLGLGRARVRLHEVLLEVDGDLAELRLGDARDALLREVDLDAPASWVNFAMRATFSRASRRRGATTPAGSCPGRRCPSCASHPSPRFAACRGVYDRPGGGVRAAVSASTSRAPAVRRARRPPPRRWRRWWRRRRPRAPGRHGAASDEPRTATSGGGGETGLGRAGAAVEHARARAAEPAGDRARQQLRRIEPAVPPAGPAGGRPGDDVDAGHAARRGNRAINAATIASASHGTAARTLRYLTRATSLAGDALVGEGRRTSRRRPRGGAATARRSQRPLGTRAHRRARPAAG